ncbi:MAG: 23S rRNA (guanosine(2251)-2'-O)-methyltransferase RlmB [Candidatus Omnitrophica bacterium]|nr:23S rRNA (guanosine(2251)-2'-O)-methyltransferase RlmB [Candidatus Omnitrophota bacterium]
MSRRPFFLYGKNSVAERLKANPQSIKKIFLKSNFTEPAIEKLIKLRKIPSERIVQHRLDKIKPQALLGGIIAEIADFEYAYLEDLIKKPKDQRPSFIFLDRIFDPQNLGAIIRTAACFGNFSVVIPKHKACEVTETVLHVACGGENYVPIVMVSNLRNGLLQLKDEGYWAVGAAAEGGENITKASLPDPICLVLGSEGSGIRYGLTKHLDKVINIPMQGVALSFNVTAACAILCYEVQRQKALTDKG